MKVPEPRKLPSGNYFIQLRLNGRSVPITAADPTECKNIAELTKAEHRAGKRQIKKLPKGTTLQEALDKYIKNNEQTLSPSTVRAYKIYAKHRFPDYREKKLGEIKWQKMIDDELKLVSPKTVKNAWRLVTPALRELDYPVPEVRLAKSAVKPLVFLQPEEIKPFCAAVKGKNYEIAALLMLHGLRVSEVRGLDWKNVDTKKEVIHVSGARLRGSDGDVLKATNKNESSARTVPIMIPQLLTALKAVKDQTGPVVRISAGNLLEDINRACRSAGVPECGNHGLRRSFASLCYHLRIPEKQIQEWGGWRDRTTMHRVYIQLAASAKTEASKTFSGFFH